MFITEAHTAAVAVLDLCAHELEVEEPGLDPRQAEAHDQQQVAKRVRLLRRRLQAERSIELKPVTHTK